MLWIQRLPLRSIRLDACLKQAPIVHTSAQRFLMGLNRVHHHNGFLLSQVRGLEIILDPQQLREEARQRNLEKKRRKRLHRKHRFVDRARLRARGGDGGRGCVSQHFLGEKSSRDGVHKRKPDGGDGGRGGSVIIMADPQKQTLRFDRPHVHGADGKNGMSNFQHGASAPNTILRVPCGVVVQKVLDLDDEWIEEERCIRKVSASKNPDENLVTEYASGTDLQSVRLIQPKPVFKPEEDSFKYEKREDGYYHLVSEGDEDSDDETHDEDGESVLYYAGSDSDGSHQGDGSFDGDLDSDDEAMDYEDRERVVLADLDKPGSWVLVALGGRGGSGNGIFASKQYNNSFGRLLAARAEPALGEVCHLDLEMKTIADLGLVGFPNSGKSSLLAAMSRATPRIAPYPFTTLHPLVGVIEYRDSFRVRAADVPGLVEGAAEGRGRGSEFLRHLERTKALLYIVDGAGVDGRDPIEDFRILVDEITNYNDGEMLDRPSLLAVNKVDLLAREETESIAGALWEVAMEAGIRFDGSRVLGISAGVTGEGLGSLSKEIRRVVEEGEEERQQRYISSNVAAF